MIAIKDMEEMPKSCCEFHRNTDMVIHCPLYNCCDKRTTIKVNFKPVDCPLIEIVTCKDCKKKRDECFCDMGDKWFCPQGEGKNKYV